jgi:hypothetical protein
MEKDWLCKERANAWLYLHSSPVHRELQSEIEFFVMAEAEEEALRLLRKSLYHETVFLQQYYTRGQCPDNF